MHDCGGLPSTSPGKSFQNFGFLSYFIYALVYIIIGYTKDGEQKSYYLRYEQALIYERCLSFRGNFNLWMVSLKKLSKRLRQRTVFAFKEHSETGTLRMYIQVLYHVFEVLNKSIGQIFLRLPCV